MQVMLSHLQACVLAFTLSLLVAGCCLDEDPVNSKEADIQGVTASFDETTNLIAQAVSLEWCLIQEEVTVTSVWASSSNMVPRDVPNARIIQLSPEQRWLLCESALRNRFQSLPSDISPAELASRSIVVHESFYSDRHTILTLKWGNACKTVRATALDDTYGHSSLDGLWNIVTLLRTLAGQSQSEGK